MRLVAELERHGVTSVVCPEIEMRAFSGKLPLTLRPHALPEDASGGHSSTIVFELVDRFCDLPVDTATIDNGAERRVDAYGARDTFTWRRAGPPASEVHQRFMKLGERWLLASHEIHQLSRFRFQTGGYSPLFQAFVSSFALTDVEHIDLLERIAIAACKLMGDDRTVAGWLRGPYSLTSDVAAAPLTTLIVGDWRVVQTMALAMEKHVDGRYATSDTAPRLLPPGYDAILLDPDYVDDSRIPPTEAEQHILLDRHDRREAFLQDNGAQLAREIEAIVSAQRLEQRRQQYQALTPKASKNRR